MGTGTIGINCKAATGSITPKIINTMVIGDILEKMGIGILGDTADGEMSNVSIAYCETGLDLLQGALQVNTLHIRECAANGL